MEAIIFIGRLLFAMIFLGSGVGHLMQTEATAAVAEKRGLPNPTLMAQVSGVLLFLGGVAIVTGFWIDLALLGLAAMVLIMAFTIHPFWKFEGEEQMGEMPMFMKNICIAGACIALFGFFAYGWDATTIVGPALDLN